MDETRIKNNRTEAGGKIPVMGEYHMNLSLSKINSSEDLNKIDFNVAQKHIAHQARESEKLIQRVE